MSLIDKLLSFLRRWYGLILINSIFKNVNRSSYPKKVLISYINYPYISKSIKNYHSNKNEVIAIANVFDVLGYQVDVADYRNNRKIRFSKYYIIFGFGCPIENSFKTSSPIFRVFYATGAHHSWQNRAEIRRVNEFNVKYNSTYLPKRIQKSIFPLQNSIADLNIILGNHWTMSTYENHIKGPKFSLYPTSIVKPIMIYRDISRSKKVFVFFSGTGLVHKGLDLCIEFFKTHQDLKLHIFCNSEEDFFDAIGNLNDYRNIEYHGIADVHSQEFSDIVIESLFTISPTCSEGASTSVLTMMAFGLIPITSYFAGIDIDEVGYYLYDLTVKSIEDKLNQISNVSESQLQERSNKAVKFIRLNCTINEYKKNLHQLMKEKA